MKKKPDKEYFEGIISLEHGDGWVLPWRIHHQEKLLHFPGLAGRAGIPSGVRIRFETEAREVGIRCVPAEQNRLFDLTGEGRIIDTAVLPAGKNELWFRGIEDGRKVLEIWLPMDQGVQIESLETKESDFTPSPDSRNRWLHYGSSISQCASAFSPARTWPGTAAREAGLNLMSMGFGGNCHLEPLVAKTIRDSRADMISLKIGINIQGGSSLGERVFIPFFIGMVDRIREKHPDTPIAAISPIFCSYREDQPNILGVTLKKIRSWLREGVERIIQVTGDRNIRYFSGLDLLGPEDQDLLPDQLHPNGTGYELMGKRFHGKIFPFLNGENLS
ncbi:MAG: SGNH/GDSL hydrolase family protein [Spirochaetia bacterium]